MAVKAEIIQDDDKHFVVNKYHQKRDPRGKQMS